MTNNHVNDPAGVILDIAAYFGATASEPDVTSTDAGRAGADEAAQADVQDDVNDYFGVEGG